MSLPRFGRYLRFAVGITGIVAPLRAETAALATSDSARLQPAVVVLVAAAGRDTELPALLTELLARRGVGVRIFTQIGFDQAELLRDTAPSSAVHVFVVPGAGGNVGLYFRAPDGERFLLRNVLLPAGFDDVGREQVAQIVETAVAALLYPGAGLTREQAKLQLREPDPTPGASRPSADPQPAKTSTPSPKPKASKPTTLESWFALRYAAVALGKELGIANGPGLELGLGVERGGLLRARLSIERDFAQTLETSQVAAALSRVRWQGTADAGLSFGNRQLRQMLLVSVGVGQDRVHVKPMATADSRVAPAPSFDEQAPFAHAELRYETGGATLRVALSTGVDVALVQTHYDVAHENVHERVARPWLVRPTGSLAVALCPRWATF
jgi:hypothetical protein